jgi:hypothetical protein
MDTLIYTVTSSHLQTQLNLAMEEWLLLCLAKTKSVPAYSMKAHRGSRCIVPLIFNLETRWRRVFNFTPLLIYLQKKPSMSIKQEAQPVWKFLGFSALAPAITKVFSSQEKVVVPVV